MSAKEDFIVKVYHKVDKYAKLYGICVHSPIIAQAILESNWGNSKLSNRYFNYFGLKCGSSWKGKSVNMTTQEEYSVGVKTTIKDNFRVYEDFDDGIRGYFEFIDTKRYSNLKGVTDAKKYCELLKEDGYATSSTYVASLMKLISVYNLKQYDSENVSENNTEEDEITVLAKKVINGEFGNGAERKKKLGSNYKAVQQRVNELLKSSK